MLYNKPNIIAQCTSKSMCMYQCDLSDLFISVFGLYILRVSIHTAFLRTESLMASELLYIL